MSTRKGCPNCSVQAVVSLRLCQQSCMNCEEFLTHQKNSLQYKEYTKREIMAYFRDRHRHLCNKIVSFKRRTAWSAEYNQHDATFLNLFISVRRCTCFRRVCRPSSGSQNSTYSVRYLPDRYCYLLLVWPG